MAPFRRLSQHSLEEVPLDEIQPLHNFASQCKSFSFPEYFEPGLDGRDSSMNSHIRKLWLSDIISTLSRKVKIGT